eukprot:jgi/Undpi1/5272/HiC_scaffold_2.g00553.m1
MTPSTVYKHNYEGVDLGEDRLGLPKRVTASRGGRAWFARGWMHILNFHHEEAMECFKRCIEIDALCAMALWGIGNPPELNVKFADAMSKVYWKHAGDLDVATVYAESLMVVKPWALWKRDEESGDITPSTEGTLLAKHVLEKAMAAPEGMEHPGILHLYCHLMELSGEAVAAMPAANVLRTLYPAAGHLTHMPSHIDVWAGQYKQDALDANLISIETDNATVEYTGVESNFYKGYRIHNVHVGAWAALFAGRAEDAMKLARVAEGMLPPGDKDSGVQFMLHGHIPMGRLFLEPYSMIKWHVMIRFGMWDEIIAEPQYEDYDLYPTGIATGFYARGIAYASMGMIQEAEAEQAKYLDSMQHPSHGGRRLHNNPVMSQERPCILKIGEAMLAGEIEYRKGNFETAFDHLHEAVRLDKSLHYDEPWGWMVPTRHALGALLLEQGHVEEATKIFRADLKMYKNNMWGLLGLLQCLEKTNDPEVVDVRKRYEEASSTADIRPTATCFCAKAAGAKSPTITPSAKKECC